jgi:hypothetical protein
MVVTDHGRVIVRTTARSSRPASQAAEGRDSNPRWNRSRKLNQTQVNGNAATAEPGEGPPIAAGAIANGGGAVLNSSQVDNNTVSNTTGGGIVNRGTITLNKSEVDGNNAAGTGVIASGGGIINAQGPPGWGQPSPRGCWLRATSRQASATKQRLTSGVATVAGACVRPPKSLGAPEGGRRLWSSSKRPRRRRCRNRRNPAARLRDPIREC